LNFQICEISLANSVWKRLIIMLNVVKIGLLVVEILQFFEFSKWSSPPSWIFLEIEKFLLVIWVERVETHQHAKFCQNRSTNCEDIKILFFDFSRWRRPPSWIVEITKFLWLTVTGWPRRITTKFRQNWSFHCGDVAIFRIFAILDF